MEGLSVEAREEYIWAMKMCLFDEADETATWKARKIDLKDIAEENKVKSSSAANDESRTRILSSFLPDEIIYNVSNYAHRHYSACLLFGDVSGFTDLCEKYNRTGKSGPSRMTQVLNSYIGSMVQEVMSHNGDVLKFSGDAFLAMWKCTENDPMRDAVHQALDCALAIQKSHGFYETDVGVVIRVKLAISAGHVIFSLIGDAKSSHYVVVGQPIWDVKAAEGKSVAGEIIVSPTAWHHINPTEYIFEEMSDKLHVKVHGVGTNWRNIQKGNRYTNLAIGARDSSSSSSDSDAENKQGINDEFSLRPAVNTAARMKLKEDLRKFIIPPVMRGIDLDEPLEYLTEMRQVVIVFINVVSHVIDMVETVNLSDRTYKIVCGIVDDMKGCVNKVSLFDKDLMLVCIFGLRGFKHNLESQVALKCAMECHQALSNLPEVKSASIGVTTGMTYCGVFGHTLRREYTVISLIVNKAARLMCAYPYKVTCDRETFLHSKMEAKNFILQEHKELKGISHPGPVYQFKEIAITEGISATVSHFPLLGRDDELNLYHRLLNELIKVSVEQKATLEKLNHQNMLVIYGDARQGKTRLMDEMVFTTPSNIPVNRYTVTNKDNKMAYGAMRKFFQLPLGLNENSTRTEWEEKLSNRLGKLKVKELMCALNAIFNVGFDKTPLFLSLSDEQVKLVSQKFIKQLCFRCFLTNWVMAIDDAEFIDEDSWVLLEAILTFDKIFTVITIGQRKTLSLIASKMLQHRRVRKTSLKSINKWFHAGLACQILDVYAIPPELEKVIQSRSNGNPGWIESYLVTLIQAGSILIRKVNRKKIADMGLIAPPLYMLYRLTLEQETKWKRIVEQSAGTHIDDWKMYTDSYKDESETNIAVKNDDILPVCTLSPSFNDGDVDQELSMDVIILKTFDSLTSFEQMILKSSSILGDCFPTDMLLYIMSCNSKRQAALAVQKLFEIRVLSCARGDFLNEGYNLIFKERLINPEHDTGINCGCLGINIDESCDDLPDYASCGYLRFRSSFFRETTYSLLTEKQKKEFHSRAVRYIEKETRQCRACGYGYFTNFLGVRIGAGLHSTQRKKILSSKKGEQNMHSSSSQMRNASMMISGNSVLEEEMKKTEYEDTPYANVGFPGYTAINRLKESYSLTKTFSTFDFSECECIQILIAAYSQMIDHCRGSGALDQMIEAMIQYSNLAIEVDNITQALNTLNDSIKALETKPKDADEVSWKPRILIGRIYTQMGYCFMKLNRSHVAIKYLYSAMDYFGNPFPKGNFLIKFKQFKQSVKQNINMFWYTEMVGKKLEIYQADYFCNVSLCLRHICNYFKSENKWLEANLAAIWGLNLCLKAGTDFSGLMQCFATMITMSCHFNKQSNAIALEVNALRICHRKKVNIQKEDISAVCSLYYAILLNRFEIGDLDKSEFLCFILIRLCTSVHAVKIMLQVLPLAFQIILNKGQISVACNLLGELEFYSEEDNDHSGLCWYYALCMQLSIETGYSLVPEKKCTQFFGYKGEEEWKNRDPEALKRYYAIMWLWCIRIEKWEEADIWYPKAIQSIYTKEIESVECAITSLFLLEASILYLVSKMDKRNIKRVMVIHDHISLLFRNLGICSSRFLFILPRLQHMKAFFRIIKYNDNKAFQMLKLGKKFSVQFSNTLEQGWIDHTYKAWKLNLTSLNDTAWKERGQIGNLMDYREFEMNGGKFSFFTLSPPTYM